MLYFLISMLFAQEPSANIIVEASRDIQIYVAPIQVHNLTMNKEIEQIIDEDAAFTYSGTMWHMAKVPNGRGGKMSIDLSDRDTMVYNERTIVYAHDNCDYKRNGLGCSVRNGHYYVETHVHVDNNQLVIKATMYDEDAQIVNTATRTNDAIVTWIKQQEVTVIQNQTREGTQTITHKPKEELPLRWEIPHQLIDKDLHQVMLGLWMGAPMMK